MPTGKQRTDGQRVEPFDRSEYRAIENAALERLRAMYPGGRYPIANLRPINGRWHVDLMILTDDDAETAHGDATTMQGAVDAAFARLEAQGVGR